MYSADMSAAQGHAIWGALVPKRSSILTGCQNVIREDGGIGARPPRLHKYASIQAQGIHGEAMAEWTRQAHELGLDQVRGGKGGWGLCLSHLEAGESAARRPTERG